jgi:ferredoxin-type protein NapH
MDKYNNRETIRKTTFWSTFFDVTKEGKKKFSYRMKRWILVIAIHLLFFLSFFIDIQTLEGTLNGSRFLGFHLIDVYTTMQLYLSTFELPINMIIGTVTIILLYMLVGGRSYCAWVCPYGLLSEIAEKWHDALVAKKIIKSRKFDHRIRHIFWAIFLILSFTSGYLVFETFNVVGILSRMIAYGWSLAFIWVVVVFALEVFFSRRAWCTYICPIGTTYGYIGKASALRVEWNDSCDHCSITREYITGADCTLCGRCIDVCHTDALKFDFRLKGLV